MCKGLSDPSERGGDPLRHTRSSWQSLAKIPESRTAKPRGGEVVFAVQPVPQDEPRRSGVARGARVGQTADETVGFTFSLLVASRLQPHY